jgi:hypothetical protein
VKFILNLTVEKLESYVKVAWWLPSIIGFLKKKSLNAVNVDVGVSSKAAR